MSATGRISTRKDRAGTPRSSRGEAERGPGSRVGRLSGRLRRRNTAGLHVRGWSRSSVRELLDSARGSAGGRERTGKTTGAVNMRLLTAEEKTFLDVFLHEATTPPFTGPATEALHKLGVEYGDISYLAWAY